MRTTSRFQCNTFLSFEPKTRSARRTCLYRCRPSRLPLTTSRLPLTTSICHPTFANPKETAMTTTTKTNIRHTTVALKLPPGVPALVGYAQNIVKRMSANPAFPNPTPSLAAVTRAVDDLQAAQAAALSRIQGAVATRNDKHAALVILLKQLRAHIQTVVDASTENGAAIIESAGLAVRKSVTRRARTFAAKAGSVSGSVKITAPTASHRASYEWQ